MINQLLLGSAVTFVSLGLGGALWWGLIEWLEAREPWLRRPPTMIKSLSVLLIAVLSSMLMMTLGVWLWAFVFLQNAVFSDLEEAVYFALVAYTTLGLGDDVHVPQTHRLLGGMTGANGFLMFGLMTATLTDTLRLIRRVQHEDRAQ